MLDTEVRELRERFSLQRRRWERLMIAEGIGTAIIGPLAIATFARFAWADAVSQNYAGLAFAGFGLGMMLVFTWKALRFAGRLRGASAAFDSTVVELRQEATKAYAKGREDAKIATIELVRHMGQSFANATGGTFEMLLEGEYIVCEPREGRRFEVPDSSLKH